MEVAMRVVLVPTLIVSILMTANAFAQGPEGTVPRAATHSATTVQTRLISPERSVGHRGILPGPATRFTPPRMRTRRPVSQKEERIDQIVIAVVALTVLVCAG
jgi:hypothetical protein